MRQVKLYTLKEDVVAVVSDHINFHNYPDRPIHVRGSDEFIIDVSNYSIPASDCVAYRKEIKYIEGQLKGISWLMGEDKG